MTHSRLTLSLVDRFLTESQQHNCSVSSQGDCVANTNCLLSNLDEYVKAGMSSGTQLLTLIPAALAILPARGPNALTAATFGYPFLLLSAFAGSIPAGAAAGEVARLIGHGTGSQDIGGVRDGWNERFRNPYALRQPAYSLQARALFLIMATLLGCVPMFLAVLFGPSMVVTWCCDRHYVLLSWIIGRMSPALVEWMILQATYWCVLTSVDDLGAKDQRQRLNLVRSGALLAQVIAKGAHGFLIIWGISVLGSTIMVDGLWAMMLLGVFPAAYSLMQLCLLGFTISSDDVFGIFPHTFLIFIYANKDSAPVSSLGATNALGLFLSLGHSAWNFRLLLLKGGVSMASAMSSACHRFDGGFMGSLQELNVAERGMDHRPRRDNIAMG